MGLLLQIILATVGFASLSCVIISLLPASFIQYTQPEHRKNAAKCMSVVVLAFIGWAIICCSGAYAFLWPLPKDWMVDKENGPMTVRTAFSYAIGAPLTFLVMHHLSESAKRMRMFDHFQEKLKNHERNI